MIDPSPLQARRWEPGAAPVPIPPDEVVATVDRRTLVWVDVTELADPYDIGHRLRGLPGFEPEMIAEVINPATAVRGWPGDVRLVRWARYEVIGWPHEGPPSLRISGLHILSGPGWLITFRRRALEAGGGWAGGRIPEQELIEAGGAWTVSERPGDDLGTLWIRKLAASFPDAAAGLAEWLHNADLLHWEGSSVCPDAAALRSFAFRVDTLAIQLRAMQQPAIPHRRAWFASDRADREAAQVDELLRGALDRLDGVRRDARAVVEQRRAEADAERLERGSRTQAAVAVLASLFLGPSLAAGVLGAVPGFLDADTSGRLCSLLVISAALSVAIVAGLWAGWNPDNPKIGGGYRVAAALLVCALVAVVAWQGISRIAESSRTSAADPAAERLERLERLVREAAENAAAAREVERRAQRRILRALQRRAADAGAR